MLAIKCRRLRSVNIVDPKNEEFRTIHGRGVRGRAPIMYSKFHKSGFHAWASRVLRACRQAAIHRSAVNPHDASSVSTGDR